MTPNLSVLFINPSSKASRNSPADGLRHYLAIGSLASALRNELFLQQIALRLSAASSAVTHRLPFVRVELLNLDSKPADQPMDEFLTERTRLQQLLPDIVGVTATSAQLEEAEESAAAAARIFPHALRVVGGPHASVCPEDSLRDSEFQVACVGEGVEALAELVLLKHVAAEDGLARLEGIAYKDSTGNVHRNPARQQLLPLDDYPFPSESLDLFWPYLDSPDTNSEFPICVLAGFGCPYDCIFCAQRCIHAGKLRERSAESIFAEVERLHGRGFRRFALVQETFLNNRQRVRRFCELVLKSGLAIEWTVEARADQVSRESLADMRAAGLKFIQLGVESGDEALLRSIGKAIRRDQIVQATEWCRELGIHTTFYMLVGLPGQGWQSILRSALLVRDHTPYNLLTRHVSVSIAIPYPGTRIARDATVRIVDWQGRSWPERNPVVSVGENGEFEGRAHTETDDMTAAEIFEAGLYLDDFCHFLMHARDGCDGPDQRAQSMEYARRLLYMIQRRTIRDLIVRAQPHLTREHRTVALHALSAMDRQAERHFKDVVVDPEPLFESFLQFLSVVRFENGFECMRRLGLLNRIKWMKLCGIAWLLTGRVCNCFVFMADPAGENLDPHLANLPMRSFDGLLEAADCGGAMTAPDLEGPGEGGVLVFGIRFGVDTGSGRLAILSLSS